MRAVPPALALAAMTAAAAGAAQHAVEDAAPLHVAVTAIAATAELDAIRDGLRSGLEESGRAASAGVHLDVAVADGDPARAAAIARQFAAMAPDVIVAISTPSARALVAAPTGIPRVFVAVDASIAGDVRGDRVALLTEDPPVADQVALVAAVAPSAQTVAVPYDPAAGGGTHAGRFAEAAAAAGLRAVPLPVTAATLDAALAQHAPGAGALFLPDGQAATPLFEAVAEIARMRRLPLIAAEAEAVANGAAAAVMRDPYATGRAAAVLVLALADGSSAVPRIAPAPAGRLLVNPLAAGRQGAPLARELLDRAAIVIE